MSHRCLLKLAFLLLCIGLITSSVDGKGRRKGKSKKDRESRFLSLFSIVQFNNDPCQSTSSLPTSNGFRNGTCYTSSECQSLGGSAQGSCASGFGVCCTFTLTSGNVQRNCTYVQNDNYPAGYNSTSSVAYTVQKISEDVCSLRLDFEVFTLTGLGSTSDDAAIACTDTFTVMASQSRVPTICGENSGEHIYVDFGTLSTDTVMFGFDFGTTASTTNVWDIKVTQIHCGSITSPPNGCLQYFTGLTGRISTFNFNAAAPDAHLPLQDYSTCIRQEAGFCCIRYNVCPDAGTSGFSLTGNIPNMAMQDDNCDTEDYVRIDQSAALCAVTNTPFVSRYCGIALNVDATATLSIPICDCTTPFAVDFFTNAMADATTQTVASRGVCLEYQQVAC